MLALAGRQVRQITRKGKRHFPGRIARTLSQAHATVADGNGIAVVCREMGLSDQSCYRRQIYCSGLRAEGANQLNDLLGHNGTLEPSLA